MQCRGETKDHAACARREQAEEDDTPADGNVVKPRHAFGYELEEGLLRKQKDDEAGDSAAYRKKHAFGQKLSRETGPARSECLANSHFASPGDGTREQEIGDVDAADDEDESHRQ